MKIIKYFLVLLGFSLAINAVFSQVDTTSKTDDFEYLFNFKRKAKDSVHTSRRDTVSLSDFYDMSLEELETLKATGVSSELEKFINSLISVSTQKSVPTRYSPNIVSLVTGEEIRAMGARDLIEVLSLVPGFHFAQDIRGNVGLGIRGNWAAEGKVLIMINGKEVNEHYTAHTYFGNHFPVDMIKRIEIVRGPGSSVHGGFAEFGVINIVTKTPKDLSGIEVGVNRGWMGKGADRSKFNFYVGKKWKRSDLHFFLSTGMAERSNRTHYGFYNCWVDSVSCTQNLGIGAYSSLANNSDLENAMMNLEFNARNFGVSSLTDIYRVTDVTSINSQGIRTQKYGYFGSYNELKYKFKITPNLSITPKINFNIQTPLEENTPYADALKNNPKRADSLAIAIARIRMRLDINYDISHRVNLIGGIDYFEDKAMNADTVSLRYKDDPPDYYSSTAFYGEAIFKLPVFHIFAGARFETNASYNSAFSPRMGITKKFRKFHLKFLVSDAYRLPTLGNLYYSFDGTYDVAPDSSKIYNVGRGLEPEKTLVVEAEAGYQFNDKTFLTANVFDMTIRNPIVFSYYQDETIRDVYGTNAGIYLYQNYEKAGTRGFELDFRFQDKWGFLNANYSFYSVENKPRIDAYSVSTFHRDPDERELVNSGYLLAFPKHKLSINWLYKITDDFSVNINSNLLGTRYGYDIDIYGPGPDEMDGKLIKQRFTYLFNLFLKYDNLFTEGLNAGIGVKNIFNRPYDYIQPFFGLKPPLPGASREVSFKISYRLQFKNKRKK